MESYISISLLNDFVFCPKSIYFHKLYQNFNETLYHEEAQKAGKIAHESIDQQKYSSAKKWICSLPVYGNEYGLCGKIDMLNTETHELIERKNKIVKLYDGYKYQVWAQYFCLREMQYKVEKIFFHSLSDNRRYEIPLPTESDEKYFAGMIKKFRAFRMNAPFTPNPNKCAKCIYRELCDSCILPE